mmetsp:Transcript_88341/g.279542  ORF Transcript_88341/g.279542 Transcript_88341/m.279542 type:complete len:226 (-) Transcript_88341:132-809(-)
MIQVVEAYDLLKLLLVEKGGLQQLFHGRNDFQVQCLYVFVPLRHLWFIQVFDAHGGQGHVGRRRGDNPCPSYASAWHHNHLATGDVGVLREVDHLQHGAHLLQLRYAGHTASVTAKALRLRRRAGAACTTAHATDRLGVALGDLARQLGGHEATKVLALAALAQIEEEVKHVLLAHLDNLVETGEGRLAVERQRKEGRSGPSRAAAANAGFDCSRSCNAPRSGAL